MEQKLSFTAPSSVIQPSFWEEFYDKKLNIYKLNDSPISINGKLTSDGLLLTKESFLIDNNVIDDSIYEAKGELINVNTKAQFQDMDKSELINNLGNKLIEYMKNGEAINDPSLLLQFAFLSYADLKSYSFLYWLCMPAIVPSSPFSLVSQIKPDNNYLATIYEKITKSINPLLQHVFVLVTNTLELLTLKDGFDRINDEETIIVTLDLGNDKSFSWSLRNLLALLSIHSLKKTSIIALRNPYMDKIKTIKYEDVLNADRSVFIEVLLGNNSLLDDYKVIGYEYNQRSKPGPRFANCSAFLDAKELSKQAVDLNIKLMKWRQWQDLDTLKLNNTKCLLFGAGTLGCAVARSLISWGVKSITIIDNGRVSYSNPVRQCLFEFEDVGEFKAIAAANRLKKIFPCIESAGIVLTVPMPGHPMNDLETIVQNMDELVQSSDVCFALTDSRESRWFPSLLAARYDKLMINAALGFDSYLVMRHGCGVYGSKKSSLFEEDRSDARLGCYFCNDIVAATNSQIDRTVDQQCTVTRGGLNFIASGFAVELMVAILHSDKGLRHPAPNSDDDDVNPIPHQLRGSVQTFSQITPSTPNFSCCTACSFPIIEAYRLQGTNFIGNVCNDPSLLLTISGIDKLTSKINLELCIDSDDDF